MSSDGNVPVEALHIVSFDWMALPEKVADEGDVYSPIVAVFRDEFSGRIMGHALGAGRSINTFLPALGMLIAKFGSPDYFLINNEKSHWVEKLLSTGSSRVNKGRFFSMEQALCEIREALTERAELKGEEPIPAFLYRSVFDDVIAEFNSRLRASGFYSGRSIDAVFFEFLAKSGRAGHGRD